MLVTALRQRLGFFYCIFHIRYKILLVNILLQGVIKHACIKVRQKCANAHFTQKKMGKGLLS